MLGIFLLGIRKLHPLLGMSVQLDLVRDYLNRFYLKDLS